MFTSMRRPVTKAVFLLCAAALVWFVPYHFAVPQTMAVSYVVGYNNKVAELLFAALAVVFAVLTQGVLGGGVSKQDQRARGIDLAAALAIIAAACFVRHHHMQAPRAESTYAINRLQMLMSGLRPYTEFEYIYGPLQLYVPLAIARLLGTSIVTGYYVWWYAQWLLGTVMLWWMVKMLPFCLARRRLIFCLVVASELPSIVAEGTAYTPVRMAGAAFCVLAVHAAWKRGWHAWRLLALCTSLVLLELGISPEQGLALGFGLIVWMWVRAATERTRRAMIPAAGLPVAVALSLLWFWRLGVLQGLREFAGGAYAFPMLPSLLVALILLAYVAAACSAVRAWRDNDFTGPAIPMALCGFAALPVVFGRCDPVHMQLGSAAWFLGLASIERSPALRRIWSPLAVLFLVVPFYFVSAEAVVAKVRHQPHPNVVDERNLMQAPADTADGTLLLRAPCAVVYGAPTIWPAYDKQPGEQCLETGFFAGTLDVLTPETIERKAQELTRLPRKPLLMRAIPLRDEFVSQDYDPEAARSLQYSLYHEPLRNAPLSYEPLIQAIEQNYTPGPVVAGGLRVWTPKADR